MSEVHVPKNAPVARIPIGSRLKMLGGTFDVTDAGPKFLVLRGPLSKLKKGQVLNLLRVCCQVTLVGHQVARLQVWGDGVFDTRPILKIDDAPPPMSGEKPKKRFLNAKEQSIAMAFDEALAIFQERVQRNATEEEKTAILQEIINPESEPEPEPAAQ